MIGRRVRWPEEKIPVEMEQDLHPGDYVGPWRGLWLVCAPNGVAGTISVSIHTITEHEDGTITVAPSILIYPRADAPGWHGYLERGVWREC